MPKIEHNFRKDRFIRYVSVADRCVWIVDADSTPILRVQSKIREQNINKRYIFIIHSEYLVRVDERVRAREREREPVQLQLDC